MNARITLKCAFWGLMILVLPASRLAAQHLTLEGQTGGFLTPTAYVVYGEKGSFLSHPAVGFHFIDASSVIGDVETFSITEGFANRAEAGYTRSVHQFGDQPTTTATPLGLSNLWKYDGMNVFHGKVVIFKDGQFGAWMPGIAVGGVMRTNDHFVSGAANKMLTGTDKSYTNGDAYIALTKTWAKPPVPFLFNVGWKATNGTIFGLGGQSTRFGGRLFGGLGIPLPLGHGIVAVPSAGFTEEPRTAVNLNTLLNAALYQCEAELACNPASYPLMKADIPTTLDYAVRVTQKDKPHFAFDIGVGQVANRIGSIYVPNPYFNPTNPAFGPPVVTTPVNLNARHVIGMGLSYRY
ncbi:MAG TPA: DUF3034 family protein [Terracidiphilus sp.]|nr:DUF3034 family protein [Terracidiphilus sp.]